MKSNTQTTPQEFPWWRKFDGGSFEPIKIVSKFFSPEVWPEVSRKCSLWLTVKYFLFIGLIFIETVMFLSASSDKVLLQNLKPLSISPYHVPEQNQNSVKGLTKQFSIPSSQTFALSNDINRPRSRISGPATTTTKVWYHFLYNFEHQQKKGWNYTDVSSAKGPKIYSGQKLQDSENVSGQNESSQWHWKL